MNQIEPGSAQGSPEQPSLKNTLNPPQKADCQGFENLPEQLSYPENDRRQTQRRQNDRSGKYDRRRNRCAHCKHFAAPMSDSAEVLGTCLAHNTPMAAMAFACPVFQSNA